MYRAECVFLRLTAAHMCRLYLANEREMGIKLASGKGPFPTTYNVKTVQLTADDQWVTD